MANTTADDWDESVPVTSSPRRQGATEISSLRKGTRLRLDKEHEACATAGVGGEHLAGSAKVYYQATAPTTRPDGVTALDSDDAGRIWIDSDDNSESFWSGSAWVAKTGGAESFDLPGSPGADEDWTSALSLPLTTPFATPLQISGLSAGRWLLFVSGLFDGDSTGDVSITANGQTKTYTVPTTFDPGVDVPFMMCIRLSVTSANHYIRITTVSSMITRIESLTGMFIG